MMFIDELSQWFLALLHNQAGLMIFVVLGLGYVIGNLKIGSFSFGPVAGVMFAGLFFGNFGFRISTEEQVIGFALFIFSVGYQAGPGFVEVLKKDGVKYFLLSLSVSLSGFALAWFWAYELELPEGMSAGILAGGLTSSPTLAAAQDAIQSGVVRVTEGMTREQIIDNIAMGYAMTYIIGLVGLIMTIRYLPMLLKVDVVKAAHEFDMLSSREEDTLSIEQRFYVITSPEVSEYDYETLREKFWDSQAVIRVIRANEKYTVTEALPLVLGDKIEVIGSRAYFTNKLSAIAKEIHNDINFDMQENAQVVVSNSDIIGKKLATLNIARDFGLFVVNLRRKGVVIEDRSNALLQKDDTIQVLGPVKSIELFGDYIGHAQRESVESDMLVFTFGIAIGLVLGSLAVTIGGISIGLGSAGGLLASGLFIGYRRSVKPTFGQLPEATRWFMMEFGLLIFMAGVGLRAGGGIINALDDYGAMLLVAGLSITIVPVLISYAIARLVLKIPLALIFGAITGAMTSGAALSVVINEAKSPAPALGYTSTYAFSNVLLAIAGSLIMML